MGKGGIHGPESEEQGLQQEGKLQEGKVETQPCPAEQRQEQARAALSVKEIVAELRCSFRSNKTLSYEWRIEQLERLRRGIEDNVEEINAALWSDLGKPEFETYMNEIAFPIHEINYFNSHLSGLMEKHRVLAPLVQQPSLAYTRFQPKGVVLLIAPWNYPFQLIFDPLVGAIAGGNCVLMKPSSKSPRTRDIIAKIVNNYLDTTCFRVVSIAGSEHDELLDEHYDHIFFTGSTDIGRFVMGKAAKHLTPVTLELGGKSPVIVDKTAELFMAARRILWGKLQNVGQTCVAPDHVFCHKDVINDFVNICKQVIVEFYGADAMQSRDYCRVINGNQWDKLEKFLDEAGTKFKIAYGGGGNRDLRYFEPTLVTDVQLDAKLMQTEIFGPILPILSFTDINCVIDYINDHPRPLALYVFSQDDELTTQVMTRTTSGSACINDTFVQFAVQTLPFGGVGDSGIGSYHGPYSWRTFTHEKGVLHKTTLIDPPIRYPPYTSTKLTMMQMLS